MDSVSQITPFQGSPTIPERSSYRRLSHLFHYRVGVYYTWTLRSNNTLCHLLPYVSGFLYPHSFTYMLYSCLMGDVLVQGVRVGLLWGGWFPVRPLSCGCCDFRKSPRRGDSWSGLPVSLIMSRSDCPWVLLSPVHRRELTIFGPPTLITLLGVPTLLSVPLDWISPNTSTN